MIRRAESIACETYRNVPITKTKTNKNGWDCSRSFSSPYAELNRKAIVNVFEKKVKLKIADQLTTIHNYIGLETMILRKGAISARKGERVLIPMNIRDGSLVCVGKGIEDWNCSAPHCC